MDARAPAAADGPVSMGGAGHTADFDYVPVYRLREGFGGAQLQRRVVRDARLLRVDRTPSARGPVRLREQLPPSR